MTIAAQKNEQFLRQGFKLLNRGMMINWRLGMGSYMSIWSQVFGRFVVLVHFLLPLLILQRKKRVQKG